MRDFRSLLSLGLLLLAAGCAEPVDDTNQAQSSTHDGETAVALDSSGAVLSLRDVPDEMVSIAEALLSGSIGTDATPAWNEESVLEDTVYRFHRPDVDGVAYYEFGVSGGGRILVSTGRHDVPVPAFSDVGEPGAVHLHRQALVNGASVARLYHLGPLFDVATDADEKVVSTPAGADGARSLEEFVAANVASQALTKSRSVEEEESQALYDAQWDALYVDSNGNSIPKAAGVGTEGSPSLAVTNVKWLYHASLLRDSILWDQFDVDSSAKTCWAGCAPVALAQVAAYLAYSERWGNPKHAGSNSAKLYPNVSTSAKAPEALALIKSLHTELGSTCWPSILRGETLSQYFPVVNESAVTPWNMDKFPTWASKKGAKVRFTTSWGGPWGGDETAAFNALRAGNPVVFGWKFTHYNVGAGAGYVNSAKYIWVNNGWGGYRDGWLLYDKNAMFFSGIVESWVKGK